MSIGAPTLRAAARPQVCARRIARLPRSAARNQSTSATSKTAGGSAHILSGLAGGAVVLVGAYGLYSFSTAGRLHSSINKTANEASKYYNEATKKFQANTPDANGAIDFLKQTAYSYVVFIPGGRGYVDAAFKDLDTLREKHADEVDNIMKSTYSELQKVSKEDLSIKTAQKVFAIFEKMSADIADVAGDAFSSLVDNHPQLKEKFGGSFDQLKQLGDQYGPQAKEQVDQTWKEVQDTLKGGFSVASIPKIKQLIDDKIQQIQKMGDDAWKEGLKQAQPYLEKNPKLKELVENNADALKQGNLKEIFDKVKNGKLEDLEGYVNQAKDKLQKTGDDAWQEGLKQAKPFLDKNPQIKELVESNAEALKNGDFKEPFEKVKSGKLDDVKGYVNQAKEQLQKSGEDAWKEGMKRAQPFLEKNPKLKELVENNGDVLKELFEKLKAGKVDELADQAKEKAKEKTN